MAMECFEKWLWELVYDKIHYLHSDNGIFNAKLSVEDYKTNYQTQSFSGVSDHHHTASWLKPWHMYCTFMGHVSLNWSKYGADNFVLWDFVVEQAVWLHNCIPGRFSGLTTMELLTKTKTNHCDSPISCFGIHILCPWSKATRWAEDSKVEFLIKFEPICTIQWFSFFCSGYCVICESPQS